MLCCKKGRKMKKLARGQNRFIIICLIVPVFLLLLFVIYPMVSLFRMSLTDWDGISVEQNFIGIQNYITMFTKSPDLWQSLGNNAVYFFTSLAFIPIELMVAAMLNTKFRGAKFFKSVTFLPYIINGVAIAYAFAYFLSPLNGGLNSLLTLVGLEGLIQSWLSDIGIVNHVLAFVVVWRFSGYHVILFSAALSSVPKEQIEAAIVDGANAWQIFRLIQLPSIRMVIDFLLFTNVAGSLQIFDVPFIMTSGGPGIASSTFTLYTINTAFSYNNFGLAATMAIAMIVLVVVIYTVQQKIINRFRKGSV